MNDQLQTRMFGKYRGTVAGNLDPKQMGRLQVQVPAVYGTNTLNWALPAVPYAGPNQGFYMIPPVGANIWVEFEGGDINSPIWTGCFWGEGQCPGTLAETKIIKTPTVTITLDEINVAAPAMIETASGSKITLTATGATIETSSGAKVELAGPKVTINDGALEVI